LEKRSKVVHELAVSVRKLVDVSADHEKRLQQFELGELTADLERVRAHIEKLPAGRREAAGAELAKLSRLLE
jgi:hypothetical protein